LRRQRADQPRGHATDRPREACRTDRLHELPAIQLARLSMWISHFVVGHLAPRKSVAESFSRFAAGDVR
jgi:hypothetical protein